MNSNPTACLHGSRSAQSASLFSSYDMAAYSSLHRQHSLPLGKDLLFNLHHCFRPSTNERAMEMTASGYKSQTAQNVRGVSIEIYSEIKL